MPERTTPAAASSSVVSGPYRGWEHLPGQPFNETTGPFFHRRAADGELAFAFTAEEKNGNNLGIVHGGSLLTFADYCLFVTARTTAGGQETVTVSLSSEFVGMAYPGDRIECRTEVIRRGRSLVFVRGLVTGPQGPLLNFSGVAKAVSSAQASRGRPGTPPS